MSHEAIYNTHPSVISIDDSTGSFDVNGDAVVINQSLVDAEVIRLQAEYDSQEYARKRKAKYDLLNQDEMRYDDVKNSTTTWVDAIDAIKAAHPKP